MTVLRCVYISGVGLRDGEIVAVEVHERPPGIDGREMQFPGDGVRGGDGFYAIIHEIRKT